MTNLEIERIIAAAAECSERTARKALEHGYMTVRGSDLQARLSNAISSHRAIVKQYSKEHYP
jgi:hypothetical protein